MHLIREVPGNLNDYFRVRANRKVDRDRTVSLSGRIYEAPVELTGKTVSLLYHKQDPSRIEVFYNNKSYGMLTPLDVNDNCKVRRHRHITEIVSKEQKEIPLETENHYRGGSLFGKGGADDEL